MSKFKQLFKRNVYFMITLIVLLLSLTFAGLTLAIFSIGNTVDQTSIGFIYLGNYEDDEFGTVLTREINAWKLEAEYKIEYQDYIYDVDMNLIEFDLDETLSHIIKDQKNKAYFNLSNEHLLTMENEISSQFTSEVTSSIDMSTFVEELMIDISELKTRKVYYLSNYLDAQIADTVIDQIQINSILNADLENIISEVDSITIAANSRFSLLNQIGELPLTNEQLSIIGSGIQAVSMNTNFNGFNFEQNYNFPVWAASGQNVRILKVNQFDFTFYNGFDFEYQILIEKINDTTLRFTLTGFPLITSYVTVSEFKVIIPFTTIYLNNDTIDALTPNVIITETDTDYTYHLLIQTGVSGDVTFYNRTETRLGGIGVTSKLFDEQTLPINEIYYENIVEK